MLWISNFMKFFYPKSHRRKLCIYIHILKWIIGLVDSFAFSIWMYYFILFWFAKFLLNDLLIILCNMFLYMTCLFSSAIFKLLSLPLTINNLIINCLDAAPSKFNRSQVLRSLWVCISIYLPRFGKFSAIIALNILSAPFSLASLSVVSISHRVSSRFFILFTFGSSEWITSRSLSLFFCLIKSVIEAL